MLCSEMRVFYLISAFILFLNIPYGYSEKGICPSEPQYHIVKKGETLSSIAKKYSLSLKNIKKINRLNKTEVSRLRIGQRLLLKTEFDIENCKRAERIAEDIKVLSESPELNSMGVKERLIVFAQMMRDIPYRFGGSSLRGIDCSAYVQRAFGFIDVFLPRSARQQFKLGEPVEKDTLSIGDLVFFKTYAPFPSHVGIYIGEGLFIHASSKERKVTLSSLNTPYYLRRFIGARRLLSENAHNEQGF